MTLCSCVDLTQDDEAMAHVPGLGRFDRLADGGAGEAQYVLGDQIGTLLRLFAEGGATLDTPVYTAFGEPVGAGGMGEPVGEAGGGMEAGGGTGVPPVTTRYGYAGAWGYGAGAWDGDPACQAWEGGQPAPGGDTWGDCASPLGTPCCDPIAELGWLHVGERYYDPAAGRFVQRDPIGIRGGFNTYAYARNLPTYRIDPDGLFSRESAIFGAFVGGTAGFFLGGPAGAGIGACAGFLGGGYEDGDAQREINGLKNALKELWDAHQRAIEKYGDPNDPTNMIHGPDRIGTYSI